jgi:predicted dehydrogenase
MICSWAARHTNLYIEFNVYGTEGFLRLTYNREGARRLERFADGQSEILYENDPRKPGAADEPKNFVGECAHFIDCIVHDREPLTNGRESRKSMAAILAAYQGDDENRIVWLEPGAHYAARPGTRSTPSAGT